MPDRVILSGIQATGTPHLGNYLGAIKRWVDSQDDVMTRRFFMIADLHALTVPRDSIELKQSRMATAAGLLAAGIDLEKSTVFMQSSVPEHAELQWMLASVTQLGELNRMTQFKDKSGSKQSSSSLALFAYPTLQAADILLYSATHVPVGDDQRQHVELTRTVARRFNQRYNSKVFTEPVAEVPTEAARVMDLQRPEVKMSKSASEPAGIIYINDDSDTIVRKLKRAVTDTKPAVDPDDLSPGVLNLLEIRAASTGQKLEHVRQECAGMRYGRLKTVVAESVIDALGPVRLQYETLMNDQGQLSTLLGKGAERSREAGASLLQEAKSAMGLD